MRGTPSTAGRHVGRNDTFITAFANDGINGIAIRYTWFEPQVRAPDGWVITATSPEAWPYPEAEYWADYFVNAFIRANPTLIAHPHQDVVMWNGRETSVSRFAQAFRSVPIAKYTRLKGKGRDQNVWIATCDWPPATAATLNPEHRTLNTPAVYGYIANPQWWSLEARVTFAPGLDVYDLIEDQPVAGPVWNLAMAPYTINTFRIRGAPTQEVVVACSTEVSAKGKDLTRQLLAKTEALAAKKEALLKSEGLDAEVRDIIRRAQQAMTDNDLAAAYEALTISDTARRLNRSDKKKKTP